MLFVGQTRFSLFRPEDPSWRLSRKQNMLSDDIYRARLYDESRLSMRSKIFLEYTVPALQLAAERSGHEVIHLVSFSESLPEKYRQKLEESAATYPILHLDPKKDRQLGTNPADIAQRQVEAGEIFGIYRLDDDDVLPVTFFEQIARHMKPDLVGMLISLPRGLEAIADGGYLYNVREGYYPMHSLGLMQVCSLDRDKNLNAPLPSPHDKSDRRNPVVIDSRSIGYFRINHAGQDHRLRLENQQTLAEVAGRMRRLPEWHDANEMATLFPTLEKIVRYSNPWENSAQTSGKIHGEYGRIRKLIMRARKLKSAAVRYLAKL